MSFLAIFVGECFAVHDVFLEHSMNSHGQLCVYIIIDLSFHNLPAFVPHVDGGALFVDNVLGVLLLHHLEHLDVLRVGTLDHINLDDRVESLRKRLSLQLLVNIFFVHHLLCYTSGYQSHLDERPVTF